MHASGNGGRRTAPTPADPALRAQLLVSPRLIPPWTTRRSNLLRDATTGAEQISIDMLSSLRVVASLFYLPLEGHLDFPCCRYFQVCFRAGHPNGAPQHTIAIATLALVVGAAPSKRSSRRFTIHCIGDLPAPGRDSRTGLVPPHGRPGQRRRPSRNRRHHVAMKPLGVGAPQGTIVADHVGRAVEDPRSSRSSPSRPLRAGSMRHALRPLAF